MAKTIKVSAKKREARAKQAQIELCFKQRAEQVHKYQSRNPFSTHQWIDAFLSGWLRQHNLGYWSFPSPVAHYRKQWEESDEPWFLIWREESKEKQKDFIKCMKLHKKRRK